MSTTPRSPQLLPAHSLVHHDAIAPSFRSHPGARSYGVGLGAVDPPGIGDGASAAEPSVLDGFLFATPVLLCRDLDGGVGEAWATAGAVAEVPVVPCCWQEAMNAMPTIAAIMHNRCLFISC